MSFRRQKIKDYFLLDTSVENMFINEYMASAPGDYVKVYLFALMYADLGENMSHETMAKHLGMEHEDVLRAWTYWEQMGVIRKLFGDPNDKFNYNIEFINLKEQLYGTSSKPVKTVDQGINTLMADDEVKTMFTDIEKIAGRILSSTEVRQITSWITDYQATPEVISYCFEYCNNKKKRSVKYVEAVVRNWTEQGFKTAVDVEMHLAQLEKQQYLYKRVFQALGFNRNATEEEKRLMDTWFDDMGFTLDKVLEACSKTSGISSPNMNYVNKVLENWHADGGSSSSKSGEEVTTSEIMNYYSDLRMIEEEEAEERRKEVYRKIPRIREIEDELNRLSMEMSKIIISDTVDKKEATARLKDEMDSMNAERAFELTDHGFELDYMDIRYTCPHCKDTGILDTGERCQCFGEITKKKIQLLMERKTK